MVVVVIDIFRCYQAIKARHRTIIGSLVSIDRSLVVGRSIHGQLTSHNFSRGSHDPRVVGQNIHAVPSRPERSPVFYSCAVVVGRTSIGTQIHGLYTSTSAKAEGSR